MKTFRQLKNKFSWDTVLITLCCAGLILMDFVVLSEFFAVTIVKVPVYLVVKTATPQRNTKDKVIKPVCSDSPVSWTFKCATEMGYTYVWKEKTGDRWSVCIRIDSAHVRLSLPIIVYLPINPPSRLEQHSKGHVLVCEQVYEDAESYARTALYSVFRRTYTGEGETVDEAGAKAVALATSEFATMYEEQTQAKAQDISDLYDFLEVKQADPYKVSVQRAFETLKKSQGRRL